MSSYEEKTMTEEPTDAGKCLTFAEFCALIPSAWRLTVAQPRPLELDTLEERPFIEPKLIKILGSKDPAVVMIVARGAVGKTTLGREIARKTGTNLWSLGQVQVGHRYLEGALAAAYGDNQFSIVTNEIGQGQRAIVLDGLDEALLRAGGANFDAFLESLAVRFQNVSGRPSLVLLSRPVAAERAWDKLNERDVQVSYYEIDYFDRPDAEMFINTYSDRGRYNSRQLNKVDFDRARNAVLDRLQEAVPPGLDPRSIVGYAPVLRLVAELLDTPNPHAVAEQAKTWKADELLRKVAEGILTREQEQKVNLPEYRNAGAWTPDEQCIRLLARRAGHTLQTRLPHTLPEILREEYERRVEIWINDHPFARETIFEEYVHAWSLACEDIREPSLRESLRDRLRVKIPPYRPTPLLLRFTMDLAKEFVSVDAADFGFLYESALADSPSMGGRGGLMPRLTLASSDLHEDIVGEIIFPTSAKESKRRVRLMLKNSKSGLWFWRQLAWANVSVAVDVRIGARGIDEFILGPNVDLDCETFCCEVGVVHIIAPNQEGQVVIEAQGYRDQTAPNITSFDQPPYLKVAWRPIGYPWSRYQLTRRGVMIPGVQEAFVRLRRILNPFRSTVHFYDLSCPKNLINRIAGEKLADDVLKYCMKKKLIRHSGDSYLLDRAVLDKLGIHWDDLQGREVSDNIANFLNAFLENDQ
jgi:hypothetical protein